MEEYCETSARSRNKLCSSFCNSCATSVASAMASAQWLSHTCRTWQGAPCEVNQKSMNALQLMIEEAVLRLNNIISEMSLMSAADRHDLFVRQKFEDFRVLPAD